MIGMVTNAALLKKISDAEDALSRARGRRRHGLGVIVLVPELVPELVVGIEDDGPGMSGADHALALSRGGRLDETGLPGAGLS